VKQFIRPEQLQNDVTSFLCMGAGMWIALTDFDGKEIYLNTTHLVSIREHGRGAIVTHTVGQTVVSESPQAIRKVLGLTQTTAFSSALHRFGIEGRA